MTRSVNTSNKSSLRKALRQARSALGGDAQQQAANGLLEQLMQLPDFTAGNRVAMYLANDGEISPHKAMEWMQQNDRHCMLPVVQQDNGRNWLLFAEAKPDTALIENRFGIPEPVAGPGDLYRAEQLDMVLLPLVGFDQAGNRIGMGGGFYDTTFEFARENPARTPVLMGLAHECQKVATIDAERWDIPLSVVVTDRNIYRLGK